MKMKVMYAKIAIMNTKEQRKFRLRDLKKDSNNIIYQHKMQIFESPSKSICNTLIRVLSSEVATANIVDLICMFNLKNISMLNALIRNLKAQL